MYNTKIEFVLTVWLLIDIKNETFTHTIKWNQFEWEGISPPSGFEPRTCVRHPSPAHVMCMLPTELTRQPGCHGLRSRNIFLCQRDMLSILNFSWGEQKMLFVFCTSKFCHKSYDWQINMTHYNKHVFGIHN